MARTSLVRVALCTIAVACRPNTTRPPFPPLPEAAGTEVRLSVPEATRRFAEALRADSLPVRKVELRDGYLETRWFDAATKRPTQGRPTGTKVVRIRAWADPARPGSSQLTVETLYRPLADPSLPERELEREVAPDHAVALKMVALLKQLVDRYGGAPAAQVESPAPADESADDQ
jgi:hypothetical protein